MYRYEEQTKTIPRNVLSRGAVMANLHYDGLIVDLSARLDDSRLTAEMNMHLPEYYKEHMTISARVTINGVSTSMPVHPRNRYLFIRATASLPPGLLQVKIGLGLDITWGAAPEFH